MWRAFSLPQLYQASFESVASGYVYIHQYRIDEYAEYPYREKEVELINLPIEEVKELLQRLIFI